MDPQSEYPPLDIKFYYKGEIEYGVPSQDCKWKGGIKARMDVSAGQVWEMVGDFSGIARWALLTESKLIQGQPNVQGCIRYCKSMLKNPDGEHFWVREKLLTYDCEKFSHSYAVTDGNMNMQGYVATLRLLECGANTCEVEWFFELDPIPGKEENQTTEYVSNALATKLHHLHQLLIKPDLLEP